MTSADLQAAIAHMGAAARAASAGLAASPVAARNAALRSLARRLREGAAALQAANRRDVDAATAAKLDAPLVDRLKLDRAAIETVAQGCEQIAAMPDPIGEITGLVEQPSGIRVGRMRVPIGVFAMI
jgi:glutamate-5-semialdehyde dehydrogenase